MLEVVYKVDNTNHIFYSIVDGRLTGFYLRNGLYNVFNKIIKKGVFIKFNIIGSRIKQKTKVYDVDKIFKITSPQSSRVLFDIDYVRKKILSFIDLNRYYLFLDFEATFTKIGVQSEIIEAGVVISKLFNEPVVSKNFYIYPKSMLSVNYRTVKFLHLDLDAYEKNAIEFKEFNEEMRKYEEEYNPLIVTWGNFDGSILRKSCVMHKTEQLNFYNQIINLQLVHKHFFNLGNDEGLFNTYEKYYGNIHNQTHDPNEDSLVTKYIMDAFITSGSSYLKKKKIKIK
jgi:sporulation inhibitor KapD